MKRLIAITLLLIAAAAWSAEMRYFDYPDAAVLSNDDRLLLYQPSHNGSKNLTGAGLKKVINNTAWDSANTKVFQGMSSAATPTNLPALVSVIRDRRGIIRQMLWENGFYFAGVPGYNHTYIYPFNGMTAVSRTTPLVVGTYWKTRGYLPREGMSLPGGPVLNMQPLEYAGVFNGLPNFRTLDGDLNTSDAFYWGTPSVGTLAPNTTYSIRSAMAALWGSPLYGIYSPGANPCNYVFTNSSSAKVMTNYSTSLCRSTFRTGN